MSEQPITVNGRFVVTFDDDSQNTQGETVTPALDFTDTEARAHAGQWIVNVGNAGANLITLRFHHDLPNPLRGGHEPVHCDGATAHWDVLRGGWMVVAYHDDCEDILVNHLFLTGVSVFRTDYCTCCGQPSYEQCFRSDDDERGYYTLPTPRTKEDR